MPLHNRRRRLAELAERESLGESFWTDKFSERARTRILHVFRGLSEYFQIYATKARSLILEDEGIHHLYNSGFQPTADFFAYLSSCDDGMMPTVLEALNEALLDGEIFERVFQNHSPAFVEAVNEILREERISWEFVGREMVPFNSREMHVEVVAPTLRLLARPGWERVEAAYQEALGELTTGSAPDAITDAGTALQEALLMIGAEGNALGPLIASAKKKGLILGHDQALLTWVSADRSQVGDAHGVSAATRDDAWLTVHVVGAILLRLASSEPRPT